MSKTAREGSLGSKLLSLRIGETMIIPEPEEQAFCDTKPTSMERQIHSLIAKSEYLNGRSFSTFRCDIIRNRSLHPMIGIIRNK